MGNIPCIPSNLVCEKAAYCSVSTQITLYSIYTFHFILNNVMYLETIILTVFILKPAEFWLHSLTSSSQGQPIYENP